MQFFTREAAGRPAPSAGQRPLAQRDSAENAIPPVATAAGTRRAPPEVWGSGPALRLFMRKLISDRGFRQDWRRLRSAALPILVNRERHLRQRGLVSVFKQAQMLVTLPLGKGKQNGESQVLNCLFKKIPGFKSE